MNVQQLIDEYALWHEVSGHSPKTVAWYRYVLTTFARWLAAHGRSTTITEITVNDARAFLQAESQRTIVHATIASERPGKLSDRTLHGYTRGIRAFWNWLVVEDYLTTNPMLRLKPPKLEKRYKEVLSVAEVERLLNHLNPRTFLGARMYAMVALLYDSGLRAGELVGLDLGDVHWGLYQVRVLGKGKKERLVPFSAATSRALRKYIVLREPFARDGTEAVFINANGERLTRSALTQAVKRLGKTAGIPRLHPHLLRHSAAVAYIMNGGDQFGLKRILGHTQLATTDIYMDYQQQHLAQQHQRFSPMARVNTQRVNPPGKRTKR